MKLRVFCCGGIEPVRRRTPGPSIQTEALSRLNVSVRAALLRDSTFIVLAIAAVVVTSADTSVPSDGLNFGSCRSALAVNQSVPLA